MLGGEAGSTSCFILPDQEQVYFSFWAYNTNYSISVPNIFDSYLLHANPIVSKTRAKGSAKRDCNNPSCVGVLFSLDALIF